MIVVIRLRLFQQYYDKRNRYEPRKPDSSSYPSAKNGCKTQQTEQQQKRRKKK